MSASDKLSEELGLCMWVVDWGGCSLVVLKQLVGVVGGCISMYGSFLVKN